MSDQEIASIIAQGQAGVQAMVDAYDAANAYYMQAVAPQPQIISGTTSSLAS